MNKILILLISTIWLSGCSDLYNYDKNPKENPTTTQGTVGDAKDLALISGANQVGLINTALGNAYEVKVLDSKSRPIAGDAITFTVLDQTSTPILTQTVTTDNSGVASLNFTPSVFGQLSIKIEPANSNNVVAPLLVPVKVIGPVDSISIVSGNNQTINAGSALSVVKFLVKDANGESVPGGSANINGSPYTANSNGEINFTLSSPSNSTGSYSFNGTLANSASATVSYSVVPAGPSTLTIVTGNNQSLIAGTSASSMTAVLKDSFNNIVPNYFCGLYTSDINGEISTTPFVTPTTVGNYTETISCGTLSATFNYSITVGALASLTIVSGDNQTITAGTALANMVVSGKDAFGNFRSGDSVDFGGTPITTSSGLATFNGGIKNTTGSFSVVASIGSLSQTFNYTVIPSALATLTIISGDNQSIVAGNALADMVVELRDAQSNLIPNATIPFGGSNLTTNSSGRATFNGGTKTVAGTYTVTASINSLSQTFHYTVTPGPVASLTIVSGNNQSITAGTALADMAVLAKDAFNNVRANDSVDFSGSARTTNSSGVATYNGGTKNTAGSFTVVASLGGFTQTFNYTVIPSAPATLTIISGNNQALIAGDTASDFVVELRDAQTNLIPNATISFSGTNKTTDSSGIAFLSPGVKTVAGSYTVTTSINSLSQTFSYTVTPGALASLVVDSGNNQVLPRSVNSNSLQLKGYDAFSNLKSGPTLTWSDGTWSTTSTLVAGVSSIVYPTPLLTGTKTITVSSGGVSTSFTLTVNNYAPLTATISTSDDLTYSVITSTNITGGDRIYLGSVTVTQSTAPGTNLGWAKSGSGTQTTVDQTPGSESNLNATLTNVSSPSDILSVISSATFPGGVTSNSCSFVNNVVDGLSCSVNNTMTFTRDKILGGAFQIKVQSSNSGGPEDYKLSNTLTTAKKVILEQYNFGGVIAVAGGTGKSLYLMDESYYPSVWNIDNRTITRLSNNVVSSATYQTPQYLFFYGGRFIFVAQDPSDSNYFRVMAYDPQTDSFAQVFKITAGGDGASNGLGFIDVGGTLNFCGTTRRNILVATDFSTSYGTSSASTGCWFPLFASGGSHYGIFTITGTGVYRRTGTSMVKLGNTFYSGTPANFIPITGTLNGYVPDSTGLFAVNATEIKKISSTAVIQAKAFGSKILVATKDSANRNKIFIYNETDSTYKKLKDFNASANDFGSTDNPIIGIYNGNAYLCIAVGAQNTIFQYDGTNLRQMAQVSSCSRVRDTSAVVDNALWFNLNNSLTRICDSSAGCQ